MLGNLDDVEAALARDFLFGRMVNAFDASYVIDADVRLCCVPSTICFATAADAERFERGFGGRVTTYATAQASSTPVTASSYNQPLLLSENDRPIQLIICALRPYTERTKSCLNINKGALQTWNFAEVYQDFQKCSYVGCIQIRVGPKCS